MPVADPSHSTPARVLSLPDSEEHIGFPTGRRGALLLLAAAASATAATSARPAALDPDAAVLAAYEELQACDRQCAEVNARADVTDEEVDKAGARWSRALAAVSEARPITAAGVRAKAAAVLTAFEREVPVLIGTTVENYAEQHEWLAYRLAQDILAMPGGGAA